MLRTVIIAAVLAGSALGTFMWWRYRRDVVHLLQQILDELRRR